MQSNRMPVSGLQMPKWVAIVTPVIFAVALLIIFREGLKEMVGYWNAPEYQHGYLIPFISLYLLWSKASELNAVATASSWAGLLISFAGICGFLLGELSSIYAVINYSFLLTVLGLIWAGIGWPGVRVIWAGLAYLVFMIPLPAFFQFNLSNIFQLWSSEIGTAFLRAIGISVYLEGNVIDLGTYQLQVVEACSGLRYLFPLVSFSFFCAYIFRGALWQKVVIFLSAVPITIFMNSFRIAVTGVLVSRYGTSQAEGFLHYFEGWIIFVACIALLFMEMAAFSLLSGRKLTETFEVEIPELGDFRYLLGSGRVATPVMAALVLLAAGALGSFAIQNREEQLPERVALNTFPLVLGEWTGRDGELERDVLEQLKLSDYLITTYFAAGNPQPVELYVAYYDSQRKGASVHSPRACLPGGGWQIDDFAVREIPGIRADGSPLHVNRAVIAKGETKALIYYWFMQRGRYLTNEYLVKWYIFWDALTRNRTDGAMVRVMVPILDRADAQDADRRAEEFIRAAEPRLYYHIPQDALVARRAAAPANNLR